MTRIIQTFLAVLVLAAAGCSAIPARKDSAQEDWVYYGGNQWNERHATFAGINRDNVAQLVPRRVLQLGEVPYSLSASPLVVDGILYRSASDGMAHAFDLRANQ